MKMKKQALIKALKESSLEAGLKSDLIDNINQKGLTAQTRQSIQQAVRDKKNELKQSIKAQKGDKKQLEKKMIVNKLRTMAVKKAVMRKKQEVYQKYKENLKKLDQRLDQNLKKSIGMISQDQQEIIKDSLKD